MPTFIHVNTTKTVPTFRRFFWWPAMAADVEAYMNPVPEGAASRSKPPPNNKLLESRRDAHASGSGGSLKTKNKLNKPCARTRRRLGCRTASDVDERGGVCFVC